jgi:uncharacterized membrane protein YwzB
MDPLIKNILELLLFFISFPFLLKWFNATRFEELFKKGRIQEIQVLYIVTVIIVAYLLSTALVNILDLSVSIFT